MEYEQFGVDLHNEDALSILDEKYEKIRYRRSCKRTITPNINSTRRYTCYFQNLHPRVGWVQRRFYRLANPTPRRIGCVLPAVTTFCGGGCLPVYPQRCWLPAGEGSASVVYHWMLPLPQQHLDDRECHHCNQGAALGRRTAGGRWSQHDADKSETRPEGNGNRGGADGRGTRRHGSALPPLPAQVGQGTEDVEHDKGGEGSPVPDGLHPRDRPPSLLERARPGSTSQHRLLLIYYRIVYGTRVLYDWTRLGLWLDSISLNVRRSWKLSIQYENNVVLNENSVEGNKTMYK